MKIRWQSACFLRLVFLGSFILLGLLFSSCSIQNQRAEILPQPNLDLSMRKAFLSRDFIPQEWSEESWWTLFEDPQLTSFIESALEKSPTLQAVEERIKIAHQSAKMQFSPLLPELDATVSDALAAFSYNQKGVEVNESIFPNGILPKWVNLFSSMLKFKWKLDIWGRQKKLYQAAVDEMKMQMAEAAHRKLILSIQVAQTYFDLQFQMRTQFLQEKMQAILKEKQKLISAQKKYGLSTEMQIDALDKQISKLNLCLVETEEKLSYALSQLGVYLSLNPDSPGEIQKPSADFNRPFPLPNQISSDLLTRRADLVAKIWAVQAAVKHVNAAKVAFFPSIDLSSFSGYFNLTYKEIFKPRAWFSSILPGASLPLFHGLKLKSNLQYMLHQYNYAVHEYNELLVSSAQEVVNSLTSFRLSQDRIAKQQEILELGEKDLALSLARYENGLNTKMQVQDQEYDLLEEESIFTQLLQVRLLSVLNLIKAIGGGYQNKEACVDLNQDFIYE